jgi:hypothetical protein
VVAAFASPRSAVDAAIAAQWALELDALGELPAARQRLKAASDRGRE